jgi:hypothetical protein
MIVHIDDAELRHAQNPQSFEIPPLEQRKSLAVGDFAKVIFKMGDHGERMWLKITAVKPEGGYEGRLDNDPVIMPIKCGDSFTIEPRHINNIMKGGEG